MSILRGSNRSSSVCAFCTFHFTADKHVQPRQNKMFALPKVLHRALLITPHRIERKEISRKKIKKNGIAYTNIIKKDGPKIKPKSMKAKQKQLDVNAYNSQNRKNTEQATTVESQGQTSPKKISKINKETSKLK